ncbi:uncharacterized protein LOC132760547 [Ruditapes philippinarum]|uniref:uncharacterized protein LOC132760547 n=1 Tax=Ruditapes philippinarum TaxID=129788 RepID=UPI00295B8F33|nr:uncharacterized protein LOC132760547 [Ruditapes philippinarum]
MIFNHIMMLEAVIVFAIFVQNTLSVPIHKQPGSSLQEVFTIHKRSDYTVEFKMNSESHQNLKENKTLNEIADASVQDFNNDLVCPDEVSTRASDPVHRRSSCPWYYKVTHEPRRWPVTIIEAESLCPYAIGSNKGLECTPVTQAMSVLIQDTQKDSQGLYVWKQKTIQIAVGFTASGRRIAESQTPSPTTAESNDEPVWAK